jgi:hypothetical protein
LVNQDLYQIEVFTRRQMNTRKPINGLPFILTILILASTMLGLSGCSSAALSLASNPAATTTAATTPTSSSEAVVLTVKDSQNKTNPSTPTETSCCDMPGMTTMPTDMPMPSSTMPIKTTEPTTNAASGTPITITGYITTEDDFAAKLGADTAAMIHMRMMAASGLGVTRQKADGTWEFYYFSGTITSGDKTNGTWTFNGTGAQLDAWKIVTAVANESPNASVPVTVSGVLKGDTLTNPGMDADGLYFPVITVNSMTQK